MELTAKYKILLHKMLDQNLKNFEEYCTEHKILIDEINSLNDIMFNYYLNTGDGNDENETCIKSYIEFDNEDLVDYFVNNQINLTVSQQPGV